VWTQPGLPFALWFCVRSQRDQGGSLITWFVADICSGLLGEPLICSTQRFNGWTQEYFELDTSQSRIQLGDGFVPITFFGLQIYDTFVDANTRSSFHASFSGATLAPTVFPTSQSPVSFAPTIQPTFQPSLSLFATPLVFWNFAQSECLLGYAPEKLFGRENQIIRFTTKSCATGQGVDVWNRPALTDYMPTEFDSIKYSNGSGDLFSLNMWLGMRSPSPGQLFVLFDFFNEMGLTVSILLTNQQQIEFYFRVFDTILNAYRSESAFIDVNPLAFTGVPFSVWVNVYVSNTSVEVVLCTGLIHEPLECSEASPMSFMVNLFQYVPLNSRIRIGSSSHRHSYYELTIFDYFVNESTRNILHDDFNGASTVPTMLPTPPTFQPTHSPSGSPTSLPTSVSPTFLPSSQPTFLPSQSPSRLFNIDSQPDPHLAEWELARNTTSTLLYGFTQQECEEMEFASRGHVALFPTEGISCSRSSEYAGVTRAGLQMKYSYTNGIEKIPQLYSREIGPVGALFQRNMSDFAFSVDAWMEFITEQSSSRDLEFISFFLPNGYSPLRAYTLSSTNWEINLNPIPAAYRRMFFDPRCLTSEMKVDYLLQRPGLYHFALSVKILAVYQPGPSGYRNTFIATGSFTKNGVTRMCTNTETFMLSISPNETVLVPPESNIRFGRTPGDSLTIRDGLLLSLAVSNEMLSEDDIYRIISAGPPNSIPVGARNASLDTYEGLYSLLNLTQIGYFDYDGDAVQFVKIVSLPLLGDYFYLNGSSLSAPCVVPYGENVVMYTEIGSFGFVEGLSVAFSDDGTRFSLEPTNVMVHVRQQNEKPNPVNLDSFEMFRLGVVSLVFDFVDPDDVKVDYNGTAVMSGRMRLGSRFLPTSSIRFGEYNTSVGVLQDSTCTTNVTVETNVSFTVGPSADSFLFCFRARQVGVVNITYQFTDESNLTGDMGTLQIEVITPLVSCPVSPLTRPVSEPPCLTHDGNVYLESLDVNLPQVRLSVRILSLPNHGVLKLSPSSGSTISVGDVVTGAIITYIPDESFFSAVGESPLFLYVDKKGNPLPVPDFFSYEVVKSGETSSRPYNYTLHVLAEYDDVNITSPVSFINRTQQVRVNMTTSTDDALLVGVYIEVDDRYSIRLTAPWWFFSEIELDLSCNWENVGKFGVCTTMKFVTYPSMVNNLLQHFEIKTPDVGILNGTSLSIKVFALDVNGLFSEFGTPLGSLDIPLVGDVEGSDILARSLIGTALIFATAASGALCVGLLLMLLGLKLFEWIFPGKVSYVSRFVEDGFDVEDARKALENSNGDMKLARKELNRKAAEQFKVKAGE
jgi:hypothetical protein